MLLLRFVILWCAFTSIGHTTYRAPEAETPRQAKPLVYAKHQLVVTNNPWASLVARRILRQGGNAVDAAIAATLVLGLTEPQSSGLGGGGFALTYQHKTHRLNTYDGREIAPLSATPQLFLQENGQPMSFDKARMSPQSVGIPGAIALLWRLHQKEGKLPWAMLIHPAETLARNGFPLSARLRALLIKNQTQLRKNAAIRRVYFDAAGQVKPLHASIKNPDYARTLQNLTRDPMTFYTGAIANDLIQTLNQAAGYRIYQAADLHDYHVRESPALCTPYQERWHVCTTPFASGGVSVLELLLLYAEQTPVPHDPNAPHWIHRFLEASKLIYADRNQYITDSTHTAFILQALINPRYIHTRSQLISNDRSLKTPVPAGQPLSNSPTVKADTHQHLHGTTALVVVDKAGNAISMTLSIEHEFGSQRWVDGFFLNNELTDFAFVPRTRDGKIITNHVMPGARPRSAIAPVMVFDTQGHLRVITGSPGGAPIICYVAKTLIQLLDFKYDPAMSSASGNLCALNDSPLIESESNLPLTTLKQQDDTMHGMILTSGIVTIQRNPSSTGWRGAADPRREGVALGD